MATLPDSSPLQQDASILQRDVPRTARSAQDRVFTP